MGIPSYFSHIIRKYPKIVSSFQHRVNNFYLDSNSIIYDAVARLDKTNPDFEKELMDPTFVPRILALFPVQSDVNVYEAYCEVWARTLNCYLISAFTRIPIPILLRDEKKYSMRHMVNVLHHMGLTYETIQHPDSGFQEKTNVLAYVVLANIAFYQGYLDAHPSIQVDGEAFVRFIQTHSQNPEFVRAVEHTKPSRPTTTMSLHSMDSF